MMYVHHRVAGSIEHGESPAPLPTVLTRIIYTFVLCSSSPTLQVLHCCAVIAPNQDVAFMLSILWTTIQLLLSGFFVNFPEVRTSHSPLPLTAACRALKPPSSL
jgi:hypothetical protein